MVKFCYDMLRFTQKMLPVQNTAYVTPLICTHYKYKIYGSCINSETFKIS